MLTTISFHPFKVIFISLATPLLFNYALFRFACCHHQISRRGKALLPFKPAWTRMREPHSCTTFSFSGTVPWKLLQLSGRSLCFPSTQFRQLDIIFLQYCFTSSPCSPCTSSLHSMTLASLESVPSQNPLVAPAFN